MDTHRHSLLIDNGDMVYFGSGDFVIDYRGNQVNRQYQLYSHFTRNPKYRYVTNANIVAWDLPAEIVAIAEPPVPGRHRGSPDGSFSFGLGKFPNGAPRPAINIKRLGDGYQISPRARIRKNKKISKQFVPLNLSQIAEVLNCEPISLEDAYEKWIGEPFPDDRMQALSDLELALRAELEKHPLNGPEVYSAGTFAKAYLKKMGIGQPREKYGRTLWRECMEAFYGGINSTPIIHEIKPVRHVDFTATYPHIALLTDLTSILTAESIEVVNVLDEIPALLKADYFKPRNWRKLNVICKVNVSTEDMFPAKWGEAEIPHLLIKRREIPETKWFHLADCINSYLRTGLMPDVVEAWRFVPVGKQAGLKRCKYRKRFWISPNTFVKKMILNREDTFDKAVANNLSYGTFAERIGGEGPYYFPPAAITATAGARLLLTLLERAVVARGGSYVTALTDSMSIVATEHGGVPGVLSYEQVAEIQKQFQPLSLSGKPFLKAEKGSHCWASRSQLYCLFDLDPFRITKVSKQGFVFHPPCKDWIEQTYEWWIMGNRPSWFDDECIGYMSYSSMKQKELQRFRPFAKIPQKYGLDTVNGYGKVITPYEGQILWDGHVWWNIKTGEKIEEPTKTYARKLGELYFQREMNNSIDVIPNRPKYACSCGKAISKKAKRCSKCRNKDVAERMRRYRVNKKAQQKQGPVWDLVSKYKEKIAA